MSNKNKYKSPVVNETAKVEVRDESLKMPAAEKTRAQVISDVPLNVRTRPNGYIVGQLNPGDIVEVQKDYGEWKQIKTKDLFGYCMSKYLEKVI